MSCVFSDLKLIFSNLYTESNRFSFIIQPNNISILRFHFNFMRLIFNLILHRKSPYDITSNSFLQIHYIFANKHDETFKDVPNKILNSRITIIRISFIT